MQESFLKEIGLSAEEAIEAFREVSAVLPLSSELFPHRTRRHVGSKHAHSPKRVQQ